MSKGEHRLRFAMAKFVAFCFLLQTSGCMFDKDAFVSDSLAALYDNISTRFIITSLADLLNVIPTF